MKSLTAENLTIQVEKIMCVDTKSMVDGRRNRLAATKIGSLSYFLLQSMVSVKPQVSTLFFHFDH